jgi:pimeloyl-ACP methyl ester carboxylesterase
LLAALRDVGDVILFDQRGTGRAQPSLTIPVSLSLPSDQSILDPGVVRGVVNRLRPYVDSLRQRGIDLDAYNTVESADDVESIREALGVDKITLWGHSYGSHLALAVIKRHGGHVDRAMLGGISGLHQRWRLPSDGDTWLARIDSAVRADTSLRGVLPDFLGSFRAMIAKLDRDPMRVAVGGKTVLIGSAELRTVIALQSGDVTLAQRLPLIVDAITSGDAARVGTEVQRGLRDRQLGTAMTYTMHLASGVDPARAERIAREAPTAILGNAINYPFDDPDFRSLWNVTDLGGEFRLPVSTSVPTLFLSGSIDGRTSISDAEEIRRGFRNSGHVIVDGAGHNFYTSTPRVLERMRAFLAGGAPPSGHLTARLVMRGPDEAKLVTDLRQRALRDGIDAAVARMRELSKSQHDHLSEFVAGTAGVILASDDKRPDLAIGLVAAATELFPDGVFLLDRLGEWKLASGDASGARTAWSRALALDPYDWFAALQLRRMNGAATGTRPPTR